MHAIRNGKNNKCSSFSSSSLFFDDRQSTDSPNSDLTPKKVTHYLESRLLRWLAATAQLGEDEREKGEGIKFECPMPFQPSMHPFLVAHPLFFLDDSVLFLALSAARKDIFSATAGCQLTSGGGPIFASSHKLETLSPSPY
jgi:hypothetical protein